MARKTTLLCSNCGKLIHVDEKKCPYCGALQPSLFGFAPALRQLFGDNLIILPYSEHSKSNFEPYEIGTGSSRLLKLIEEGHEGVDMPEPQRKIIRHWLDAGAEKVILGTAATPEILAELPRERVIAALDGVDGEVVLAEGYGRRSLEGDLPVTPDTKPEQEAAVLADRDEAFFARDGLEAVDQGGHVILGGDDLDVLDRHAGNADAVQESRVVFDRGPGGVEELDGLVDHRLVQIRRGRLGPDVRVPEVRGRGVRLRLVLASDR